MRLVALAFAVVAVVVLAVGCGDGSASNDPWSESWREVDASQHCALTLSPSGGGYTVTYPRSLKVPFHGELQDDALKVYGENASDVV